MCSLLIGATFHSIKRKKVKNGICPIKKVDTVAICPINCHNRSDNNNIIPRNVGLRK